MQVLIKESSYIQSYVCLYFFTPNLFEYKNLKQYSISFSFYGKFSAQNRPCTILGTLQKYCYLLRDRDVIMRYELPSFSLVIETVILCFLVQLARDLIAVRSLFSSKHCSCTYRSCLTSRGNMASVTSPCSPLRHPHTCCQGTIFTYYFSFQFLISFNHHRRTYHF